MTKLFRAAVALWCATALLLASPAAAEDKVLAKVNGKSITEADVRLAESEIGNDLGSLSEDQRKRVLVEYLIENQLLAEAGEVAKLGSGPSFDERLRYWQRRALRDAYFEQSIKATVSEADARKFYDAQAAASKPQEEVRARHILVESEVKAKEVFELIAHGAEFEKMAKEHSKDPGSRENGGDLGYFRRGQMVPVFEEAAFRLKAGEVSQPFKSQFGWHIMKVEDKRQKGLPPFDAVKARIMAALVHRKAQEVAQSLRDKAQLEFVDPQLKAQVDKENQPQIVPMAPGEKK
ncbi:MAG: peptidylprolyl isomerase [Hyphomicrobiaceae bacterium]